MSFYSIGILVGFSVGVVIGATAIAALRSGVFPKWFGFSSAVVAVAVISSGGALVHDGFYAPDGGYALIATAASLVWALVASVLLMRRSGQKEAAAG